MRAIPARLRRRLQEESGWSLIELLAAMSIFTFVLVGVLGLLDTTAKKTPKDAERAQAIADAQVGLNKMVRELRQAHTVLSNGPQSIEVLVRVRRDDPATPAVETHIDRHVRYSCGDTEAPGRCSRVEVAPGALLSSGTAKTVIARLVNTGVSVPADRRVFDYTGNANSFSPSYVKVHIEVPAAGTRTDGYTYTIALEDGFYARNVRASG